jgi:hypothetical protein
VERLLRGQAIPSFQEIKKIIKLLKDFVEMIPKIAIDTVQLVAKRASKILE